MDKIIMRNYALDVEDAILGAILRCQNRATDFYRTEPEKIKYRMQLIVLKQLLATTKEFTETIKNDI
jgi:hypothetical protein